MKPDTPTSEDELARAIKLAELDLDYSEPSEWLDDLTKLAAHVAGTSISLVNLVDTFTQWTISSHGLPIDQMSREDSVCRHTIYSKDSFEVTDLTKDPRFLGKFYVTDSPSARYYFGVPLTTKDGFNLGALCVLDQQVKELSPEKVEMLKIIAGEIINRLLARHVIRNLKKKAKNKAKDYSEAHRKMVHDIRGPIGGIISVARLIIDQGDQNKISEVLDLVQLILKSGTSLLELADEILKAGTKEEGEERLIAEAEEADSFDLLKFRGKLIKLYTPQALAKKIAFDVTIPTHQAAVPFQNENLLQIAGNLISNAIKFTPENGSVKVHLEMIRQEKENTLKILISDTGKGLSENEIQEILRGPVDSSPGTKGEHGYGLGLPLVKHLVEKMNGSLHISSGPSSGARFKVLLPLILKGEA